MRLDEDEHVVIRTRAHPRRLLRAAAVLVSTAGVLAFVVGWLERPDLPALLAPYAMPLRTLAMLLAAAVVVFGTLRPLWRWATGTTVLTSERLVQCRLFGRPERAMPLPAIAAVDRRRRRGSSAGDLLITFQEAFHQVHWRLADVPEVERFEAAMAEQTLAARRRHHHSWPAAPEPAGPSRGRRRR